MRSSTRSRLSACARWTCPRPRNACGRRSATRARRPDSRSPPSGPKSSMTRGTDIRIVHGVVTGSLLCVTALCVVMAWQAAPVIAALLALIAVTCMSYAFGDALLAQKHALGPALALVTLNLLLVIPELTLRAVDFRYESGLQFGYPRPIHFARFLPHCR